MAFVGGIQRYVVQAFHRLGEQITSLFRPGPALRTPDFLLDIRRRVDAFFAGLTGSPQTAPQPLDQTGTRPPQTPLIQLHFKERHRTRGEEEAPSSPVIVSFPNPIQDEAVKKAPKPEAPREEARATVATVTVEERRTKHVVTAPPPAGRRTPAPLKKRAAEKDLCQRTQALRHENSPKELRHPHRTRPNRAEQGAPPPSDLTEAPGLKKKRGRLQRSVGQVLGKRVVIHKKATKSPAAVAAQPTPVAARRRPKPIERKHKSPNEKIKAWHKKKPKHAKKLARHIESQKYTYLSVLRSAREHGPAHLHHAALNLIQHFRSTAGDKDWQQEAWRVLSAEVTARKSAGDRRPPHGLERLVEHFKTYAQSSTPDTVQDLRVLQDLQALGMLITELQQTGNQRPARSDLKDDAVRAFARDLDSLKGDRYLLGEGELAELASRAMQKGQQEQRELAWKLLQFQASDYPGEKELPEYFAIVAESDRETMTHAQANAACDLARAFLKQAYDFRDDGSKFRYDPTALAFLKETGELLSRGSRKAKHHDRSRDVKNLYVDGLVTIPMEAAVKLLAKDPRYAKTAQLVNMLVQGLFNIDDRFPGFSDEARSVFQVFVQTLAGDVWPFLETMGASS
jgi:hypothetical protein